MEMALTILNLLNTAVPGIAQLILLIKNTDGTITVAQLLDQSDKQFDANIKSATDWLKAHPQV